MVNRSGALAANTEIPPGILIQHEKIQHKNQHCYHHRSEFFHSLPTPLLHGHHTSSLVSRLGTETILLCEINIAQFSPE